MQTYPYPTPEGIIDLVRKDDHDAVVAELIDRLREARESHLHTSARDVQTIQRQSVELSKLEAEINQEVAENTNLRQSLHDVKKLAGQLAEAASKCRHWHDTQDGVIISAESFWNLKDAAILPRIAACGRML